MIEFRIQSTPNPNARKYVINQNFKNSGKVSYTNFKDCSHVPLAESLLLINGVSQVHFFENVLTVTQNGNMDWAVVDAAVQTVVREQVGDHNPDFTEKMDKGASRAKMAALSPELAAIDTLLDEEIRPALQMDGGDIELVDLVGSILSVRYMGACGGCPSSMTGTLHAITQLIHERYRPGIEIVVL